MTFLAFLISILGSSPADNPAGNMGQQYQAHWEYFGEAAIAFQVQLLQIKLVFQADCGRHKKTFD